MRTCEKGVRDTALWMAMYLLIEEGGYTFRCFFDRAGVECVTLRTVAVVVRGGAVSTKTKLINELHVQLSLMCCCECYCFVGGSCGYTIIMMISVEMGETASWSSIECTAGIKEYVCWQ